MASINGDKELIGQILSGDPEAFDSLFSCYFSKIYSFVSRRVVNRKQAEVLTETILSEAVNAFDRYDGTISLDRWMFQITGEVLDFQKSIVDDRIAEAI